MMTTTIGWDDVIVEVCMYVCVLVSTSWFLVEENWRRREMGGCFGGFLSGFSE